MVIDKLKITIITIVLLLLLVFSSFADGIHPPYVIDSLQTMYVSNPNGAKLYKKVNDENSVVKEKVLPMGIYLVVYAELRDDNNDIWYYCCLGGSASYGSIDKFPDGYRLNIDYNYEYYYINGKDLISHEKFEENRDYYINSLIQNKIIIDNNEYDFQIPGRNNEINQLYEKVNRSYYTGIVKSILLTFVLTLIIEILIAIVLGIRQIKNLIIVFIANILTNIPLNIFFAYVYKQSNVNIPLTILVSEIIVIIIESIIYIKLIIFDNSILNKIKNKNISAIFLSMISNIASYFIISCIKF